MNCLICNDPSTVLLQKGDGRTYYACQGACGVIFVDPTDRLNATQERERYELHNNDPNDEGYRDFLRRLTDPLIEHLHPGAHGLDFGCGPGPTVSRIMKEAGFTCDNYDPYFMPNEEMLQKRYDFIIATEVFEHLYDPLATMERLSGLLRTGGVLAIMTEMVISPERFENWWYHTDPTHVFFYAQQTMEWLAQRFDLQCQHSQKNVIILKNS